jgi:hypothetical protein
VPSNTNFKGMKKKPLKLINFISFWKHMCPLLKFNYIINLADEWNLIKLFREGIKIYNIIKF